MTAADSIAIEVVRIANLRRHCRAPVPDPIGDDPAIHHSRKSFTLMDARVKPAHDEAAPSRPAAKESARRLGRAL
jgi:hypothetical protein